MPPSASASAAAPVVSGARLAELLANLRHADSVELKLTVAEQAQRSAIAALGLDPLGAQVRLVHFFDTPDLVLSQAGLIVRARRVQGKGDDTVVKLRPVVPDELPEELRRSPDFVVEVDVTRVTDVCSASLKGVARRPVREVLQAGGPLHKVFTKAQRAFYAEHAPDGLGLDDLTTLGPIFVLKLKGTPAGLERKLVAELWLYPDGARILELSAKAAPGEAFQLAAELRAFLAERDIAPADDQETKTRKALAYFSTHTDAPA
jgi:hypothetical protein